MYLENQRRGRPKKPKTDLRSRNCTIDDATYLIFKKIGRGNFSRGLRESALELVKIMEQKPKAEK